VRKGKKMKVFMTGATGFIGNHTVKRLARTNHKLYCLVRNSSLAHDLEKLGTTLITGDVTEKETLLTGMKGCDCVIHLANVYSFWEPDKQVYTDVNVNGTQNVMECALETEVSKVVHVSSVAVYGKPAEILFNEETPVGPVRFSEYARSKYEGDLIAWDLYNEKGLPLVMVYPGAVLGAGDNKFTGEFIKRLVHGKMPATVFNNSVFTYVHVRDVAETIVRALEKRDNIGEGYIVGKYRYSSREVLEMIKEISGVSLPSFRLPNSIVMLNAVLLTGLANLIKKPPMWGMSVDAMRTVKEGAKADGSKAERELGITYTPLHDALEEAIQSYQA